MTKGIIRIITTRILRAPALALAAVLALTTGACTDKGVEPSDVSLVEWTTSFGFCPPEAYCTTRLRVTGDVAVVSLESRQSPTLTTTRTLTAAEADELALAATQARFDGLGSVIGCPDCADGGAETLSVTADGKVSTVTFEYNAAVAPLEPLLGRTRDLAARIRPTP